MKVLLIAGSPSPNSHTRALVDAIDRRMIKRGMQTRMWDMSEVPLPTSQPSWHKDPLSSDAEIVCDFYGAVMQAQAVVLATPLYHGSYSGVLKNALDCLTGDAFANKAVGIVSHGSNARKSHQPCLHLTTVAMTMKGQPLLTQIGTTLEDYDTNDGGYELTDIDVLHRIEHLVEELEQWGGAWLRENNSQ